MKCPECNSEVGRDWLICPNCGLDLSSIEDELSIHNSPEPQEGQTTASLPMARRLSSIVESGKMLVNYPKYIVGAMLFLVILGGGAWFSTLKNNTLPVPTPTRAASPSRTSTPKKPPTPLPSATYPPLPQFTVRHYDQGRDGNLATFWSNEYIPGFSWATSPGDYFWKLNYPSDTSILVYDGWCALSKEILDQNMLQLQFIYVLDGYDITDGLEVSDGTQQMANKHWVCRNHMGVVEKLNNGKHNFVYSHIFLQALNDGQDDYKKGNYIYNFTINIP